MKTRDVSGRSSQNDLHQQSGTVSWVYLCSFGIYGGLEGGETSTGFRYLFPSSPWVATFPNNKRRKAAAFMGSNSDLIMILGHAQRRVPPGGGKPQPTPQTISK
jgi:hypothetical protein